MSSAKKRTEPGRKLGWPVPKVGQIVSCEFPPDDRPDDPGPKRRPALVWETMWPADDLLGTTEDLLDVIYGTSIDEGKPLEARKDDGLCVIVLPRGAERAKLKKPTIFRIDQFRALGYAGKFFVPKNNSPIIGELPGPVLRAFFDMLMVDGFVCGEDPNEPWCAHDGPLYGTIQKCRFPLPSGENGRLCDVVVLSTPWRSDSTVYVDVAPFAIARENRIRQNPKEFLIPSYENSETKPIRFREPRVIDFDRARTLEMTDRWFPNATTVWRRERLPLPQRCTARSVWAERQLELEERGVAAPSGRLPPPGWSRHPVPPGWP